ncbi:hypothetical protein QBZ16_004225 [Prototheca wickerhamii]|uniref:Pyruvate kinase n=1 Tax=Prototheca wickerhamii TaxID=3111 RepID=A0AAD9IHK7_PROWI|nr:hypothetical protein QBZ16_004225 [Prototheca wickerhamii]
MFGFGWARAVTVEPHTGCRSVEVLTALLEAGMACARIDLTWGTMAYHEQTLSNLAEAMRVTNRLCAVWLNTMGREITVRRKTGTKEDGWEAHEEPIRVVAGSTALEIGQVIVVGRYLSTGAEGGTLSLAVRAIEGMDVVTEALNDASLEGLLTVMVAHASDATDSAFDLSIPIMTEHDCACIREFGKRFEIDYIALSYCSSAADIRDCRAFLDAVGMVQTKVIAKVERKPAVRNFSAIALAADGILLSRGNLGLDFEPELMALLQKRLVGRCNMLGKPVLVTRFVDTMVSAPRPTRAEATDVANAVLDGVDGILLGAETLRGHFPVLTVETVVRLCRAAEMRFDYRAHHELIVNEDFDEEIGFREVRGGSEGDLAGQRHGWGESSLGSFASLETALAAANLGAQFGGGAAATSGHSATTLVAQALTAGRPPRSGMRSVPSSIALATGRGTSGPVVYRMPEMGHASGLLSAGPGGAHLPPAGGAAATRVTLSTFGSVPARILATLGPGTGMGGDPLTYMAKLESVASNATRTAEKISAGLIVVMSASGRTTSLVAKFRPPMPILAVVVPTLRSDSLSWRLEGKYLARQCLTMRGVYPMLAAPMSSGSEDLLSEAIAVAVDQALCAPLDYVVCITADRGALVVKVVQVDEEGEGIRPLTQNDALPLAADNMDVSFTAAGGRRRSSTLSRLGSGANYALPRRAAGGDGNAASPRALAASSPLAAAQAPSPFDTVGSPPQNAAARRRRPMATSAGLLGAMTDANAIAEFARAQQAKESRLPTLSEQ